jgi:hypothetical protein
VSFKNGAWRSPVARLLWETRQDTRPHPSARPITALGHQGTRRHSPAGAYLLPKTLPGTGSIGINSFPGGSRPDAPHRAAMTACKGIGYSIVRLAPVAVFDLEAE